MLKFVRYGEKKIFDIIHPFGIKMLTGLRWGISHLREHKFRHDFKYTVNPLCSCSFEAETTTDYFMSCHFYSSNCAALMNELL